MPQNIQEIAALEIESRGKATIGEISELMKCLSTRSENSVFSETQS